MNDKEKIYFNFYKDKSIGNSDKLHINMKNIKGVNVSLIYHEIVNYQVKKYGTNLTADFVKSHSKEETKKLNIQAARRWRKIRK